MRAKLKALRASPAGKFAGNLYGRYRSSQLPILAAALAFYAAFSLGPLLLLLAGGLGYLLRQRPGIAEPYQEALVAMIAQVMPLQDEEQRTALVEQSFQALLSLLQEGALLRSLVSLVILVWASTNFFASLQFALELIFDSPRPRGFWRKRFVAVLLVLTVAVVIFFEIVGGVLVDYLRQLLDLLQQVLDDRNAAYQVDRPGLAGGLNALARAIIATSVFTLCFRYLPRHSSTWLGALLGGMFSTASLLVMRELVVLTFNVERFNLIYGVITSLVFVLLWLYLALLLVLFGALLAAEVSSRIRRPAG